MFINFASQMHDEQQIVAMSRVFFRAGKCRAGNTAVFSLLAEFGAIA
jgi:hypothetical protein